MKRILMLAAAAICLCGPSLSAQQVTINEKSLLNKIERSDADIANPKKSGKASTWIHRGEVFYEVATAVSKHLYDGIDVVTLTTLFGEPTAAEVVELNGNSFNVRKDGIPNMKALLAACLQNGCHIAVDSDAHSTWQLRHGLTALYGMLEEMNFPEELIINATTANLAAELKLHGKACAKEVGGILV